VHLLHGSHALAEVVHVQVLEAGARDDTVEVHPLVERVDLDVRLRGSRQGLYVSCIILMDTIIHTYTH
jgi:hypothetical protein